MAAVELRGTAEVGHASPVRPFVTVVSGYPRSGTSMMMQMLEAGGLKALHDPEFRPADERNPRGYYEIKQALALGGEESATDWVADARGKAVKVIAYQLKFLPPELDYRVVFMRRRAAEVLASSGEFKLLREDSPLTERDKIMAYKTEYAVYEAWLLRQAHLQAVFISYNDVVDDPAGPVADVCRFLHAPPAPPLSAEAMAAAVDPSLYRQRVEG
jgi:hypothetical protein